MFCDIAGSTELSSHLDPEDLRDLIEAYQLAWGAIIRRYDGHIARYMGDGILVYFGYPIAHEDDAERAAYASLEILDAVARLNAARREQQHFEIAVRLGIATGLVVVGGSIGDGASEEEPVFGVAPNLAARLQAVADPNSVAIEPNTRRLLGSGFVCEDLGSHEFKGLSEPVTVWRLLRPLSGGRFAAHHAGPLTATIGRKREFETVGECWARVCRGDGQVILISGEPGMGKSHLAEASLSLLAEQPHATIRCQCSGLHATTAFYPIIKEVERSAGISHKDDPAERLTKLEVLLRGLTGDIDELAPAFGALLSSQAGERHPDPNLGARQVRRMILSALVRRLILLSCSGPVVFLLDDAQWADPSTLEFLASAVEGVRSARILILITARPEFTPGWAAHSHVTRLALGPLARSEALEMVELLAGGQSLSGPLLTHIADYTDGVPLFVEEFTNSVLEASQAIGPAALPARALDRIAIPLTLQESLTSRLDRLGSAKPVAQLGATIGRVFSDRLLSRIWPFDEAALRNSLEEIEKTGLITRREQGSDILYVFKHELIRDCAYDSLLKAKRQLLHAQIAQFVTSERESLSDARPELIAYHYTAAGLAEKAAPFWLEAGQLALRESAIWEARADFQNGLDCLEKVPNSPDRMRLELRLQSCLGQALIALSGHASPETHRAFSRAHEICLALGNSPELFSVIWGITAHHLVKGDIRSHLNLSAQLISIAESTGDSSQRVVAHTSRTLSLYFSGQFVSAGRHLEDVLASYEGNVHKNLVYSYAVDRKMIASQFGTWILWTLGFADQAAELEGELNDHARRLGHPASLAQALTGGASIYMLRREPDRLLERVQEGIAVAKSHGYPVWVDHGDFWLGWAMAEKGRLDEGLARLQRALAAYRRNGAGSSLPKFLGLLADRLGEAGRHDEGLGFVDQAIAHIERWGERSSEAETYRLRGKLLFGRNPEDVAAAEAHLRRAMEIARAQQAKAWELRAATTLAGLLQRAGRRGEARDCLAPVYEWFSEGLDTPDLREARGLLDELG